MNRYIYALNNPLRFVDPTGFSSQEGGWWSRFGSAQTGYWSAIIVDPAVAVYNFIFHPFQTANSIAYTAKHPGQVFGQVWQNFTGDLSSGDPRRQDHAIGTIVSLFLPGAEFNGVKLEQYSLKASESGLYPVMERGFSEPQGYVHLNAGDVWKYGTTKNPATRYTQTYLDETGLGLRYESQLSGTLEDALTAEKNKIVDYFNQSGLLPPGNKIIK